tara:strand:- start:926 stop:1135 length:210 start_codon:yes stop_codon:yes gene_type:complete
MPRVQGSEAVLKAIAWERAKGELRACVSASVASQPLNADDERNQTSTWLEFDKRVEAFISDIEDHGRNQ